MQEDLKLFQTLVNELLKEENLHPVAEPIEAEKLFEQLDLALVDDPALEEDFANTLRDLVLSTPRTATRLFFNQLFGGRKGKAVLGDLLAVMLNNSMYTYKVAGPQVGVEKEVINTVCKMIGYGEKGVGTFVTGGSLCNFMALLMARDVKDEALQQEGVRKPMVAYTSADSHYSIQKNAAFAGIGRRQVRFIETNDQGEMLVDELEMQIKADLVAGYTPFFVNATAGTTVLGAFDPIRQLSEVCEKYDLWLHVDGAYCGSVFFSESYKHLMDGIELSNSFSFNAHKMLGTPLTCSILVTRNRKALYDSFANDADYLYQTDGDEFNLGKTSLQCGRRNDALKFWTLWKSIGTKGLEKLVNQQFYLADIARNYLAHNPEYTVYSYPDSISVCFNYKDIPAKALCTALYEHSELMVGFGQFREDEFIRLVTINSDNTADDILEFFRVLEAFANANRDLLLEPAAAGQA